jgi:hypothetical protein
MHARIGGKPGASALPRTRLTRTFNPAIRDCMPLDKSLRDHLSDLDKRLGELNAQLMDKGRTLAEHNNIESEIRANQLILDYYLRALQLQRELPR